MNFYHNSKLATAMYLYIISVQRSLPICFTFFGLHLYIRKIYVFFLIAILFALNSCYVIKMESR